MSETTDGEVGSIENPTSEGNGIRRPRVFISYSHQDQEFVIALVERLEARGIRVWIDYVELVIGDSLIKKIGNAIHEGDFVIGVVSQHSVTSPWCQKELEIATTRGINEKRVTVLPIRLGGVDMPSFLTDIIYGEDNDPATLADELVRAIEKHSKHTGIETVPALVETEPRPVARTTVPANERPRLSDALDRIEERIDEVFSVWDRRRDGGVLNTELVAEQRRLRTLLERLPPQVERALPFAQEIAHASWNDYFRVRSSSDAEPDIREELRAIRAQVEQGLPLIARWRIVASLGETTGHGRDATAYLWKIEREGETRTITVYISGTATAISDEHLLKEVAAAEATQGRSVVVNLLGIDEPPSEVSATTEGVRWELP